MAKLTKKERDALPARDFALPATRQFPIEDRGHAEDALRMMGNEPPKVQQQIKRAVHERYPDLGGPTKVITHGRNLAGRPPK
ncbi:MAG: hypothetical protein ABSH44_17190 [Bryobacteraceae bacterium]|jgi:hypothetical protein